MTYRGTAEKAGEERGRQLEKRQDRQTGAFCLYPQESGKPLQGFKPGNDTIRLHFPKDDSHCRVGPRWGEGRWGVGGPAGDLGEALMSRDGSLE